MPVPLGANNKVSFDATSKFMVVESDSFNNITVYDISSHLVVFSIALTDVIHGVEFFNGTTFLIVMGQGGNFIIDTRDSEVYSLALISNSSVYAFSHATKTLYQCKNNLVS